MSRQRAGDPVSSATSSTTNRESAELLTTVWDVRKSVQVFVDWEGVDLFGLSLHERGLVVLFSMAQSIWYKATGAKSDVYDQPLQHLRAMLGCPPWNKETYFAGWRKKYKDHFQDCGHWECVLTAEQTAWQSVNSRKGFESCKRETELYLPLCLAFLLRLRHPGLQHDLMPGQAKPFCDHDYERFLVNLGRQNEFSSPRPCCQLHILPSLEQFVQKQHNGRFFVQEPPAEGGTMAMKGTVYRTTGYDFHPSSWSQVVCNPAFQTQQSPSHSRKVFFDVVLRPESPKPIFSEDGVNATRVTTATYSDLSGLDYFVEPTAYPCQSANPATLGNISISSPTEPSSTQTNGRQNPVSNNAETHLLAHAEASNEQLPTSRDPVNDDVDKFVHGDMLYVYTIHRSIADTWFYSFPLPSEVESQVALIAERQKSNGSSSKIYPFTWDPELHRRLVDPLFNYIYLKDLASHEEIEKKTGKKLEVNNKHVYMLRNSVHHEAGKVSVFEGKMLLIAPITLPTDANIVISRPSRPDESIMISWSPSTWFRIFGPATYSTRNASYCLVQLTVEFCD